MFSDEGYFLHAWNSTLEMPHGIFTVSTPTDTSIWITDVGTGMYNGNMLKILCHRENRFFAGIPLNSNFNCLNKVPKEH